MNADLALSIAMTTCSTLLAGLLMPLNLLLWTSIGYSDSPAVEMSKLFLSIGVAISGIIAGTMASFYQPRLRRMMSIIGNVAGVTLVLFSVFYSSFDDPLWGKEGAFYVAVASPLILGLFATFLLALFSPWLSRPEAVALTVETVHQNTGLAVSICLAAFGEHERGKAAGVPLYYAFVQNILTSLFLMVCWKSGLTYAPSSTSLWRLLAEDWQPKVADFDKDGSQQKGGGQCSVHEGELQSVNDGEPHAVQVADLKAVNAGMPDAMKEGMEFAAIHGSPAKAAACVRVVRPHHP